MNTKYRGLLDIVIVAKNEEAVIERCIRSVLEHASGVRNDVVVADSASTDRTVEIARKFPVRVLRLGGEAPLSAAAGRYWGTQKTTAPFLLFLDGDMILCPGWAEAGLAAFDDSLVAATGGRVYRVYPGEELTFEHMHRYELGRVKALGGAGIYRREVLQACGSFNPFVKGEEERELGFRIRRGGYQILRLDLPMAYHLEKPKSVEKADGKAAHFLGVGQILRAYPGSELARDVVHQQRTVLLTSAGVVLWLCALAGGVAAGFSGLWGMAAGAAIVLALGASALKGPRKALLYVRFRLLVLANIVRGFGRGIRSADDYSGSVRVLEPEGPGIVPPSLQERNPSTA